jgi:hypothetical protein
MLVLGDRFETLGACYAATYAKIPIAHIHGGEATYGAFDDHIRHAITKLSHLHFAAAEPYAERLRRMGERRVWTVGAPGLDNLTDLPPRRAHQDIRRDLPPPHPRQMRGRGACGGAEALPGLRGHLDRGQQRPRLSERQNRVCGHSGAEAFGAGIHPRVPAGRLCHRQLVVGDHRGADAGGANVNIGARQAGRERGPSIDCHAGSARVAEIATAIKAGADAGMHAFLRTPTAAPAPRRRSRTFSRTSTLRGFW